MNELSSVAAARSVDGSVSNFLDSLSSYQIPCLRGLSYRWISHFLSHVR